MQNLITNYRDFLFEEESIDTQISNTRLEMSKVHDEWKAVNTKYNQELGRPKDEAGKIKAESDYLSSRADYFTKTIPLINKLKSQLDQKLTELKS